MLFLKKTLIQHTAVNISMKCTFPYGFLPETKSLENQV